MPTISFVIPAYNEECNIAGCIESIRAELARRPTPAQIIVVDNASTDDTARIAGAFPEVLVVYEPRKRITYARQAGLRRCEHELVANIDSDARLPRFWLDRVIEEYERNPRLGCLSGPHRYDGARLHVRMLTTLFYGVAFTTYAANRWILRTGSMAQGGNFVCLREALEAIGGSDTSIQFYGEDMDIAQRLYRMGDVKFTLSLPIIASSRRLDEEGVIRSALVYTVNYLCVVFKGRPYSSQSRDIRPPRGDAL